MNKDQMGELEAMEAEMHIECARWLLAISGDIDDECDVRIQITEDGSYAFHYGDSSYDQDHRGYWGAASIGPDADERTCQLVAQEIVEQALDEAAGCVDS